MSFGDQVNFQAESHPGFLKVGPKDTVNQPDRGEILNASITQVLQFLQEMGADHKGIGTTNPGEDGSFVNGSEYLMGHFTHNLIGISVGHQTGQRAASSHPIAARIVDDDQIDSPGFFASSTDSGAGTAPKNWPAALDFGAEMVENVFTFWSWHEGNLRGLKGFGEREQGETVDVIGLKMQTLQGLGNDQRSQRW